MARTRTAPATSLPTVQTVSVEPLAIPAGAVETLIPADKIEGNQTIVANTEEVVTRAGVDYVKVYVKA